jgi:hypothetical protein
VLTFRLCEHMESVKDGIPRMAVSGMYPQTQHRIELHSNSAPDNRARRYVLTLTLNPSAPMPYIVSSQWGRSGWFLRGESYTAPDERAALAQMRTLLKRRRAHGYSAVSVDSGHPLAGWLVDEDFPRETATPSQPDLFDRPVAPVVDDPMQGRLFRR